MSKRVSNIKSKSRKAPSRSLKKESKYNAAERAKRSFKRKVR